MSEFTDELKRLDLAINLPSKTYFAIEEKFKDWQLPKALPEVPQCVADAINALPDYYSVYGAIEWIRAEIIEFEEEKEDWIDVYNWIFKENNANKFAMAWIYGYTVKKEKLYYIKIKKTGASYLNLRIDTGDVVFADNEDYNIYKTKFSEQEIKDIDERYWPFAVPVDEV